MLKFDEKDGIVLKNVCIFRTFRRSNGSIQGSQVKRNKIICFHFRIIICFSPKSGEEEEPSGLLANYLSDPDHVFVGEDTKAMLMLAHNLTDRRQLAEKRFR